MTEPEWDLRTQHEQDLLQFSLLGREVKLFRVEAQFLGSDQTDKKMN